MNEIKFEQKKLSKANEALIREYLDITENDSENLDRTMKIMADDAIWVIEPTGDTYSGYEELEAFVETAMSSRKHEGQYSIEIKNWFTDGEYLCIEYTHGGILTGAYLPRVKTKFKKGIAMYCITFHMKDGKFDEVHEYIQGTTFLSNLMMPVFLKRMNKQTQKKFNQKKGDHESIVSEGK